MSYLTSEAKAKLSSTIRTLRERLLTDLQNAAESVYRLSIRSTNQAGLTEAHREQRRRLETWLDEQVRAESAGQKLSDSKKQGIRERCLLSAQKLAAATLLNRLVVIKQMEALGLVKPAVVTEGWQSPGYREFREFAPELCRDETEGYGTLLQLLYDELALEMPGLFRKVRLTSLFPIPAGTLRAVVEALNDPVLANAWLDDTTLGWVYQYWNDPEREELDAKLNAGGKVEPHEIASKTQMFTERYMVEWLLHNSLGQMWLAICQSQGWKAEVEADGTLDRLEERRQVWREKREKGEVALDELMPIETEAEEHWKYWVPQPLTEAAVAHAPKSIREVKILDPACGSGHFLVIAFGLLFALYQEEARHRGEDWSDREIVESILANNLFGVDIDARAVQIAAAALFLKAKSLYREAEIKQVNLVASDLNLSALPGDDPALAELRREVREATGIPEELTNQIVQALQGADQWGSLLKIDREVEKAIADYGHGIWRQQQKSTFDPDYVPVPAELGATRIKDSSLTLEQREEMRGSVLEKLESFLTRCTRGDDLGLRLRGEQLTAGVRFIRLIRENTYDVVVGNPPYQGSSKMDDAKYLIKHYSKGKSDLYAAFLERGLQLAKTGGVSALITIRAWMFINQYSAIREYFFDKGYINLIGDLHFGAFTEMKDVSVAMTVLKKNELKKKITTFIQPVKYDLVVRDTKQIQRNMSGLLVPYQLFKHQVDRFAVIKEKPIVYWWDDEFLDRYAKTPKMGDETDVKVGLQTSDNVRFLRQFWEVKQEEIFIASYKDNITNLPRFKWVPYIKGAVGKVWFEPLSSVVTWEPNLLEIKQFEQAYVKNERFYFCIGIAFPKIGANFSARMHRYTSVIGDAGCSVFPKNLSNVTCLMNSSSSRQVTSALNPTVNFQVGDVIRLPLFPIESADEIFAQLDRAFTEHEAARETSVEFKQPGASCWNYAQQWAQQAVDRELGKPLPDWNPVYDQPPAVNWVSYEVGVALGRFGANGEGILTQEIESALPNGILYLSAYAGDLPDSKDSLNHPAAQPIEAAWTKWGSTISKGITLRNWLRLNFFKDVHTKSPEKVPLISTYEQRPIYFPLSSSKKNFVAFVSIHRWADTTLPDLLAEYLAPELSQLEGELADLIEAKSQGDRKSQASAEKRYSTILQLHDELKAFIELVQQCAELGPPPANPRDTPRETNAKFKMDLDDGVMINSATLWPLLTPQWSKPKTWWSELCNAKGKKDYDWSHLAARYFPNRVDAKCQQDPSLAVAHGCFWKYHPAKAYEWELRLQDEIAPEFTIDEIDSDLLRQQFETEHPQTVIELKEKEEKRRERKRKKENDPESLGPLFEADQPEDPDE